MSAAGAALGWGALGAEPVQADECLLDRDNDGVVDAGMDNDGGADSSGSDARVACGVGAQATGGFPPPSAAEPWRADRRPSP